MPKKSIEINPECAHRLKAVLKEQNKTQTELAQKAGYEEPYISNIINAKVNFSVKSAKKFATVLGIRQEYLLCEDNCKTIEELEEFHKRKKMSHLLDMKITSDIAILASTIVKNIETNNENSFISNSDYNEFRKDISDYIQMRTEKWLLPRLKEKQDPES